MADDISPEGFSVTLEGMILDLRLLRERHRDLIRAAGCSRRNAAIVVLRDQGYSLSQIADVLQISRERVRILERRARAGETS